MRFELNKKEGVQINQISKNVHYIILKRFTKPQKRIIKFFDDYFSIMPEAKHFIEKKSRY